MKQICEVLCFSLSYLLLLTDNFRDIANFSRAQTGDMSTERVSDDLQVCGFQAGAGTQEIHESGQVVGDRWYALRDAGINHVVSYLTPIDHDDIAVPHFDESCERDKSPRRDNYSVACFEIISEECKGYINIKDSEDFKISEYKGIRN